MASLSELRKERIDKLKRLKDAGRNPYPSSVDRSHSITAILDEFEDLLEEQASVRIVGRIMAVREHGGSVFVDVEDPSGQIQVYLKKDMLDTDAFELFKDAIDIGDFVVFEGICFETNRGEESVKVKKWEIAAKSLRPLPEKWHGLQDKEKRFRRRYLDMLFNDDVKGMVRRRARFFQAMREFMEDRDFLEVQTPVLENTTGGADARPFKTHHNALDMDVFLRISAGELWQKQLVIAGFEKVFEIGRIFRNEGMSPEHLQDYMQMEFYWSYADYEDGMKLVQELFRHIAEETFDTLEFTIGDFEVDLGDEWERYDFVDTVEEMTGCNVLEADKQTLINELDERNIEYEAESITRPRAMDALWKHCRKQIAGPGFLIGIPKALSPLAKTQEENSHITERFQPIIAGSELGNGYSELNDPLDQAERFEKQQDMRDQGDDEAQMYNKEFVEALEYGMPPTCGFGVSERLFAFLEGKSVRETQLFPLMRPDDKE